MRRIIAFMSVVLCVAAVCGFAPSLEAGVISTVDLPATGTDAASGISPSKTYTHLLDFGTDSGVAVVNGVTFTLASASSGPGYVYSPTGGNVSGRPDGIGADGGMAVMLYDAKYNGTSLTLSGLTEGTAYSTRLYYRQWNPLGGSTDPRPVTVTFNGDGITVSTSFNECIGGAHYLQYDFTANGDSVVIGLTSNYTMYGASNEVVLPEPSTLASLGIAGLFGLVAYAWRKRR